MSRTICAIATAPATAALGIIRLSGSSAFSLALSVLKRRDGTPLPLPASHHATYCRVEADGEVFDEVVATFYQGPRSYTGEDVVELCCHGGLFVLDSVLKLLIQKGASLAEPGEFSKRAFLNGKMDLVRAQAVIDLIEASSRAEQKNALSQLNGHLSAEIQALYERLVDLNTALLAYVDFPEEVEAPEEDTLQLLMEAGQQLERLLADSRKGQLIREGLQIAIVGAPNVGKSTLLNQLLGYRRSIVSPLPGTTRDLVTEGCQLGGLKCHLADTAGIHATEDPIEMQGISLAREKALAAQVVFALFDGSRPLEEDDRYIAAQYGGQVNLAVINKADLPQKINDSYIKEHFKHVVTISAQNGAGCEALDQWVRTCFSVGDTVTDGVLTGAKQAERLQEAHRALTQAMDGLKQGFTPDLVSIDITEAAAALGEVTGQTVTEQMIDRIFSRFCVGK